GDVDRGGGIGVGAGGVVDAHRRLTRGGLKVDLAHCDAERADVDLAAAADRAGRDAYFEMGIDVGHESSPLQWGETVFAWKGRFPPYAGVSRIRFGGSKAAAFLSTAHQRSPGDGAHPRPAGGEVKGPERRQRPRAVLWCAPRDGAGEWP